MQTLVCTNPTNPPSSQIVHSRTNAWAPVTLSFLIFKTLFWVKSHFYNIALSIIKDSSRHTLMGWCYFSNAHAGLLAVPSQCKLIRYSRSRETWGEREVEILRQQVSDPPSRMPCATMSSGLNPTETCIFMRRATSDPKHSAALAYEDCASVNDFFVLSLR